MTDYPIERTTPEEYHCKNWFCTVFNHWLNPLGNWLEPKPYPEKHKIQAEESRLPEEFWWFLRNPFHNFMTHWIGIVPIGPRYSWIRPESNGWSREHYGDSNWYWWRKANRPLLPFYRNKGTKWEFYLGWTDRGDFGMAMRRVD